MNRWLKWVLIVVGVLVAVRVTGAIWNSMPGHEEKSSSYQLGYRQGDTGTAASLVKAGVGFSSACQSSLTNEYVYDTSVDIKGVDYTRGCMDAVRKNNP